jgi:hypothetical protein
MRPIPKGRFDFVCGSASLSIMEKYFYRKNERKAIMIQSPFDLRGNLFIQIPTSIFDSFLWKELPLASKEILPAILKYSNEFGTCFPSQKTIADLAGVTEKTVREGLKGLDGLPSFYREKYVTRRGHTSYRYRVDRIHEGVKTISIRHPFFNEGNWSQLNSVAKAVFPVLKYFSWWDFKVYEYDEDIEIELGADLSSQNYPYRLYDYANPEPENVAEYAGISLRSLKSAYASLSEHHFIEHHGINDGRDIWRVFVHPPMVSEPEFLNAQVIESYSALENITY